MLSPSIDESENVKSSASRSETATLSSRILPPPWLVRSITAALPSAKMVRSERR